MQTQTHARRIELDTERKLRTRNKLYYRFNHWPIWIFVFFIAPGPFTADLFAAALTREWRLWLGLVLVGTGIAGLAGKLPGCEPAPYIIRFTEDRPNPLYRRICYTTAWSEVIAFAGPQSCGVVRRRVHRRMATTADVRRWRTFQSPGRCGSGRGSVACRA